MRRAFASTGAGAAALAAALALSAPSRARADDVLDDIGRRLTGLEAQAAQVEASIHNPVGAPQADPDLIERRIVQAQVAYGVGRYDDAALLLYDIVEKYPQNKSYPDALFYLADSLFQRGDNLVARAYFQKIVAGSAQTPHYGEALERLLEVSLRLQDQTGVKDYLAKLDALPATGKMVESVPYVRGKYAYFTKSYDEAARFFSLVPPASKYDFQARYFTAVNEVARGNLAEAAKILHALIKQQPKGDDDAKVLELSHLALGRLHYERDQPSEAIDHYLALSRHSTYFDEALYEVAWVYVKAKQYDKALRALELLALANPKSAMLPDVRILEGNLRIRKAQAQGNATGNATEDYAKATKVFEDTRATYEGPKKQLDQIIAAHEDPRVFFAQVLGRASKDLEMKVELPDVVVAWMREVPEVQRIVGVTKSLDEIRQDLDDTTSMIDRLERAIGAPARTALFPGLAERRGRAEEIGLAAFALRQDLANRERILVLRTGGGGELDALEQRRAELARKLAALPQAQDTLYDRVLKAKGQYLELDKKAQQTDVYISTIEAQLVAIDKYYHDLKSDAAAKTLPAAEYEKQLGELRTAVDGLRKELGAVRQEIGVASDEEGGVAAPEMSEEQSTRKALSDTLADEHRLAAAAQARMGEEDRQAATQIGGLIERAQRVEAQTAGIEQRIDRVVDGQLVEVRATIAEEKGRVAEYERALHGYDGESGVLGGDVVAGSFTAVSKKFYDIGVRSDVGLLDVSWSQKELAQQSADRLRLDFAHEKQQIDAELRRIRDEDTAAAPAPPAPPAPAGAKDGGTDGAP
jgi:tetratricopeptide (TPR) repeat protein